MQTASEIKSALGNMSYYADKISGLMNKQIELDLVDVRLGEKMREKPHVGSLRFNALGEIASSCGAIKLYCKEIEEEVKIAEEQEQ